MEALRIGWLGNGHTQCLGMDILGAGCELANGMDVVLAWAWMCQEANALGDEHVYTLILGTLPWMQAK